MFLFTGEHKRAQIAEEHLDVEKHDQMIKYRQEIEEQLESKEREKQVKYEEFLKEKLLIDEIVRKIYEEDARL